MHKPLPPATRQARRLFWRDLGDACRAVGHVAALLYVLACVLAVLAVLAGGPANLASAAGFDATAELVDCWVEARQCGPAD